MTDESNGNVIPTESRTLDGKYRRSGAAGRPVTVGTTPDGASQHTGDVATTPDGVTGLLVEVVGRVVDAPDRDGVERILCERLVGSSHYRSALVGERTPASAEITVHRRAGFDERFPNEATIAADGDGPAGRSALERALDTGTVQVLDGGESELEPWLEPDGERDVESAAVPLSHDGTSYGVLAVATSRPGAFDESERRSLGVVGSAVGATVSAIENRELLFADGIVELELRVTDHESLLVRVSDELGCTMTVEDHVSAGDRWLLYCDVDGADAETVATTACQYPAVDHCRVIQNRDGRRRLELTVGGSSSLWETVAPGARVRSAVADHGVCHAFVEVPRSAAVREVVSGIRTTYPDLELRSIREHDRPPADPHVSCGVLDELTDRQRDVLRAAYRAGYFDWPRESTAEEVANGLDISGPTFLGHIRKAEKQLLADLLD